MAESDSRRGCHFAGTVRQLRRDFQSVRPLWLEGHNWGFGQTLFLIPRTTCQRKGRCGVWWVLLDGISGM